MKKLIILLVALATVGGLGWYASKLMQNKGQSDTELIEFAIEDIESVDRVIITDRFSNVFEVKKNGEIWTDKDGGCVTQDNVEFILDAFKNIEFKGYLSDNSHDRYTKVMATQHIKVEIFQDGNWTKTWFIGPAAPDHHGQVMLLDSEEFGKSSTPVLMKIKGLNGFIDPRFYADPRKWECTDLFSLEAGQIAEVDVKFNDEPERSFRVTKNHHDVAVYQQGKELKDADDAMIYRYLNAYKKIHYNLANYELSNQQVDSMKQTTPFCELSVKETNGQSTKLKCYRIKLVENVDLGFTEVLDMDRDKFWCELPDGRMVKCQYFVFNPLILGHVYFPMDVSMLNTEDGMLPKEPSDVNN